MSEERNPLNSSSPSKEEIRVKELLALPVGKRALEVAKEDYISKNFEKGSDENELAYHETGHTDGVWRRAVKIAQTIGLSERETELVQIAAAFHDVIQEWQKSGEGIDAKRERFVGTNEEESAYVATAWMKKQPDRSYSPEDIGRVERAIRATVPSWDGERGTVFQQELVPGADVVLICVALADLGSIGMEPKLSANEGDQLFAEEHMGIMELLRAAKRADDIPEETQTAIKTKYVEAMRREVAFAKGRYDRFLNIELPSLPQSAQGAVKSLFNKFPETIRIKEHQAKDAEKLTFRQVALQLLPYAFSEVE
jgi:hypothetical protein